MRKYTIIVCLLLFTCFFANAQSWIEDMIVARKKVDSLKQQINITKGDKRIDCLNLFADTYFWIWDEDGKVLDTACIHTDRALKEKSTRYQHYYR